MSGQPVKDTGNNGGFGPAPGPPRKPPSKGTNPGGSPGLLTSTGGLFGFLGGLYVPFFDSLPNIYCMAFIDPSDFNCEEDASYDFKVEDINIGRAVAIHKLVVVYRNLGVGKITFGVRAYQAQAQGNNKFVQQTVTKTIGTKSANLKLYTQEFNLVVSGERPQAFMSRLKNQGPVSIVSVVMVGDAGETKLL